MGKITTLDKLHIGQDAIISSIECEDKALRQHILDMGLTPDVEVTLIKTNGEKFELKNVVIRGYGIRTFSIDQSLVEA